MPLLVKSEPNRSGTMKKGSLPIAALLALGFFVRLFEAAYRYLNADETLHYLLSVVPSAAGAYHASLTTVHPPLLILFLHYWGMLGHSELFLRLPSLMAGTAFCWLMYRWLRVVSDHDVALFGLVLLLFCPALVLLSAEIRQYALLLFFSSAGLYLLELAIQHGSALKMLASAGLLALALLTHYSSLVVALSLGVYALLRFISAKPSARVLAAWIFGQLGALAIVRFLYVTHISKLESRGAAENIAATYLRRSVFHPGEDHVLPFVLRANLRLFHFFFYQGAVGVIALFLFLAGVAVLLRRRAETAQPHRPSDRVLAAFFLTPFAVNCALAVPRIYPYGGTRHNSYLAIFLFPPIALALAHWQRRWKAQKIILIIAVSAICLAFPAPTDQYMAFKDQNRARMLAATEVLAKLPPGSSIFTDDQGALTLSYYLCHHQVAQIEHAEAFMKSACGDSSVVALHPGKWIFKADTFAQELHQAQRKYDWNSTTSLWLFQAGWFIDKESELRQQLQAYGCAAGTHYGRNILLCRLALPAE
jgi:dolichyl-phosphate-mannose-protein mannosyltransferase